MAKKRIEKVSLDELNKSIQSRIDGAFSLIPASDTSLSEVKTAKTTAASATYELVNPIGKKTEYMVTDGGLIRSIEIIKRAVWIQRVVGYATCRELARIDDSGILETMGISKIADFGKAFFGFEPSTVNHYVRIGRMFIEDVTDENGNVTSYKVKDGLPMLSISHFIELNAFAAEKGVDAVIDLYLEGELTDGMPVKKLREKLQEIKNTIALPEGSATVSDADGGENGESVSHDTDDSSKSDDTEKSDDSSKSDISDVDGEVNSNIVIAHIMEALQVIKSNAALLGVDDSLYMPALESLSGMFGDMIV